MNNVKINFEKVEELLKMAVKNMNEEGTYTAHRIDGNNYKYECRLPEERPCVISIKNNDDGTVNIEFDKFRNNRLGYELACIMVRLSKYYREGLEVHNYTTEECMDRILHTICSCSKYLSDEEHTVMISLLKSPGIDDLQLIQLVNLLSGYFLAGLLKVIYEDEKEIDVWFGFDDGEKEIVLKKKINQKLFHKLTEPLLIELYIQWNRLKKILTTPDLSSEYLNPGTKDYRFENINSICRKIEFLSKTFDKFIEV